MNVVFITGGNYPNGDAQSIRIHSCARVLLPNHRLSVITLKCIKLIESHFFDGVAYSCLATKQDDY